MHFRQFSVKRKYPIFPFFPISYFFFFYRLLAFKGVSWRSLCILDHFHLKKIRFLLFFSDFADLRLFDRMFLTICLILPPPLKPPDSPRVPHCRFILKIGKKSQKNRISDADPPKMDFRFLIYTPKYIFKQKKKKTFLFNVLLPKFHQSC